MNHKQKWAKIVPLIKMQLCVNVAKNVENDPTYNNTEYSTLNNEEKGQNNLSLNMDNDSGISKHIT